MASSPTSRLLSAGRRPYRRAAINKTFELLADRGNDLMDGGVTASYWYGDLKPRS